jgi:hypothetical protein
VTILTQLADRITRFTRGEGQRALHASEQPPARRVVVFLYTKTTR